MRYENRQQQHGMSEHPPVGVDPHNGPTRNCDLLRLAVCTARAFVGAGGHCVERPRSLGLAEALHPTDLSSTLKGIALPGTHDNGRYTSDAAR